MKSIFLASDHAGFYLKEYIKSSLAGLGYLVEDLGSHEYNKDDDYPEMIRSCAEKVSMTTEAFGIVLGGSGTGEAIAANKVKGIRCALYYGKAIPLGSVDIDGSESVDDYDIVRLSRLHNNANMLSIGARFVSQEDAVSAIKVFLETEFGHEERHQRRIDMIEG